ncbi:MAG TPA: helix-turn-helix transcriptional regulator [Pseudobdellovibrionaceae bacterium]
MKIGEFLKQKRLEAGLSQGSMAKRLGYTSPQFISNWERGLSKPPRSKLKKISLVLKINSEQFFDSYIDILLEEYRKDLKKEFK